MTVELEGTLPNLFVKQTKLLSLWLGSKPQVCFLSVRVLGVAAWLAAYPENLCSPNLKRCSVPPSRESLRLAFPPAFRASESFEAFPPASLGTEL